MKPVNIVFDNVTRARDMLLRARRDVGERPGDMSIGLVFVANEAPGKQDPAPTQLRSLAVETKDSQLRRAHRDFPEELEV